MVSSKNKLLKTRLATLLIFVVAGTAHELCLDFTSPVVYDGVYETCQAYNSLKTCVPPSAENATLQSFLSRFKEIDDCGHPNCEDPNERRLRSKQSRTRHLSESDDVCFAALAEIGCAKLDAWSAHLFSAEGPVVARPFPNLCLDYCHKLYNTCLSTSLVVDPFIPPPNEEYLEGVALPLYQWFEDSDEFCSVIQAVNKTEDYCYDGKPYVPIVSEPVFTDFSLCFEKLSPAFPALIIVPFPQSFQTNYTLLAIGYQDGIVEILKVPQTLISEQIGNYTHKTVEAAEILYTFLELGNLVESGGERGLLGLAFHPNFDTNHKFYLSYTCDTAHTDCIKVGNSIIEEVTAIKQSNRFIADLSSRRTLLTVEQPFSNHNGGQILFGPKDSEDEENLFVMFGDGGSANDPRNNAQNRSSLLGKVLRIKVTPENSTKYVIPQTNPFKGNNSTFKEEIFAYGLRNPWRCSFDVIKKNPTFLYCGDVGQGEREEIDIITKGGNFGWRKFEGFEDVRPSESLQGTGHVEPILQYTHSELKNGGKASVTGGFVYRGDRASELYGNYVFGDFYGQLFLANETVENGAQYALTKVGFQCSNFSPETCDTNQGLGNIFTFGEDEETRDIYVGSSNGLFRITTNEDCLDIPQTNSPSLYPTKFPTKSPSLYPTNFPSNYPTHFPTRKPTNYPTTFPTRSPSEYPTNYPTNYPTAYPTRFPSNYPTPFPTKET